MSRTSQATRSPRPLNTLHPGSQDRAPYRTRIPKGKPSPMNLFWDEGVCPVPSSGRDLPGTDRPRYWMAIFMKTSPVRSFG